MSDAHDAVEGGGNGVLGKAKLILEAFELGDDSLTLTEIAARTGVSKATVRRLNQELFEWGMLERHGVEYRLGMRAFELGGRVPRFRALRNAVRSHMEGLHHRTREAVHLAVPDGLEALYLEKFARAPQAARPSRIAAVCPCTPQRPARCCWHSAGRRSSRRYWPAGCCGA